MLREWADRRLHHTMMRRIRLTLAHATIVVLCACGGGGTASLPATTLQPVAECWYPNGTMPQMVYPVTNSTNVPDNFYQTGIIVADTSAANYDGGAGFYYPEFSTGPTALANFGMLSYALGRFQPIPASELPPQASPASLANPYYEWAQMNPSLPIPDGDILPHTRYYVYLQQYQGCYAVGPIGSFTTQ